MRGRCAARPIPDPPLDVAPPSEPSPSPAFPPALNDAGVRGRTRPLFEELPPGPPAWPGWLALGLAVVALLVAGAISWAARDRGLSTTDALVAGACLLGSGGLLLVGLVWIPLAGILRRRVLPENRYRGGSVIALLLLAIIGGAILSAPVLLALANWDANLLQAPPPALLTFELLVTPLSFLAVLVVFVALPRALPGLRLWRGWRSVAQLAVGAALGVATWIAIGLAAAAIESLLSRLGINLEGQQEVVGLATKVNPVVAVLTIAILAPIAEELFFRGLAFNAWEREYGTRRAVFGSSLLFSVAHIPGGGGVAAVVIIFALGLILALVFARTRTIATTIGLHAFFNLATLVVLFAGLQ
jgi:membrane protease YdiL (CAAX protease family)